MRPLLLVMMLSLAPLHGCHQGDGFVHGDRLDVEDCGDQGHWEPFDMSLEFLGVVRAKDVVMLRASATSQWSDLTDSLLIHIASYDQVRSALDLSDTATLSVSEGEVAIGLSLLGLCPDSTVPLEADNGVVTFTRLGTVSGDQVTGVLTFDIADKRTGEVVGTGFDAAIDFQVEAGTPFELFSDVGRQHGK
ncbi:MAG: hypothetical protein QF464_10575 [Myxococcota bacterium]|jgi:hypothetical protein|nr:hypothetical protein [Myxococcota bacterium]